MKIERKTRGLDIAQISRGREKKVSTDWKLTAGKRHCPETLEVEQTDEQINRYGKWRTAKAKNDCLYKTGVVKQGNWKMIYMIKSVGFF